MTQPFHTSTSVSCLKDKTSGVFGVESTGCQTLLLSSCVTPLFVELRVPPRRSSVRDPVIRVLGPGLVSVDGRRRWFYSPCSHPWGDEGCQGYLVTFRVGADRSRVGKFGGTPPGVFSRVDGGPGRRQTARTTCVDRYRLCHGTYGLPGFRTAHSLCCTSTTSRTDPRTATTLTRVAVWTRSDALPKGAS